MNSLLFSPTKTKAFISRASLVLLSLLALQPMKAGTPLTCTPYDIGNAKSLQVGADRFQPDPAYDRTKLVGDTLALLTPKTPIIVRMETLRRAAIYATENLHARDRNRVYSAAEKKLALDLVQSLRERTQTATAGDQALALFDLGFFCETLRQAQFDEKLGGYEILSKAAELRPNDAEIQFALALASSWPKQNDREDHLAKARAGAKANSLLAINLSTHFEGQ
jgi:hypothetical protein